MAAIEYDRWFCTCGFEFTLSGEGGLCPHRRDGREHKTVKEAYVTLPAADYRGAVEALRAIYDRHHMVGDGSAGQVSGDALRALGIDPDLGESA
jgi:hypothetical protein